jgi:hypothetical protein
MTYLIRDKWVILGGFSSPNTGEMVHTCNPSYLSPQVEMATKPDLVLEKKRREKKKRKMREDRE